MRATVTPMARQVGATTGHRAAPRVPVMALRAPRPSSSSTRTSSQRLTETSMELMAIPTRMKRRPVNPPRRETR